MIDRPSCTDSVNRRSIYPPPISLPLSVYLSMLSSGSLHCACIHVASSLVLILFKMARTRLESLTLQCTATNRVRLSVPTVWSDFHTLRLKWVFNAYDELLQMWCYAEDLDSFEHAGSEVVTFMTGEVGYLYFATENNRSYGLRLITLISKTMLVDMDDCSFP